MTLLRNLALVAIGLGLSACASVDTVTRNAPFEPVLSDALPRVAVPEVTRVTLAGPAPAPEIERLAAPYAIKGVRVEVPRTLRVSEANRYLPKGDIVWRGDPIGDRYAQVRTIFEAAMVQGAQSLDGGEPVDLLITVKRFHALTEKARYAMGGVHSISFDMALADPATGAIVSPWRAIEADLDGFGGAQAIEADRQGQTQKVRITNHLAEVLRQEITQPEGHRNAQLGLIQALNKF